MPVTHPVRKPDGQRLCDLRTKACKRLNTARRGGSRRVRGRRGGQEKAGPPAGSCLAQQTLSGIQAPTFSVPFMMAQWPGKEQKNA